VRRALRSRARKLRPLSRDAFALDKATVRRVDHDGHLHVEMTPISKANVCPYFGREIPDFEKLGLEPDKTYQLYRDPDELERAAASFAGKPLLLVHTPVTADEHPRQSTVGSVGNDVAFKAPYLMAPLSVWDGEAIGLIDSGEQKELSSAYRYRADMTPGKTPDGEAYDGVMRDIAGNHVALVKEGRAGPDVVVGDSKEKVGMSFDFSRFVFDAAPKKPFDYDKYFQRHNEATESRGQSAANASWEALAQRSQMSPKQRKAEREAKVANATKAEPSFAGSWSRLAGASKRKGGGAGGKTKHDPSNGQFTGDADPVTAVKAFLTDKLSPQDMAEIERLIEPRARESASNGAQDMNILSRKGAVAQGALMVYLAPKMAKDAKPVDLAPVLKGVTAKNFGARKAGIVDAVKEVTRDKLAQDADIADLTNLLDALEKVETGEPRAGDDLDPNSGIPMAPVEDADDPKARVMEFLKDKLSPEDMAACAEMWGEPAMDETDDEKAAREERERAGGRAAVAATKDKPAKDAEMKDMVTKKAMDEKIASERQRQRDVREAERFVRPWIGDLAIAYDSADDVYKAAIEARGKSTKDIHPSAFRAILEMLPKPGTEHRPAGNRIGMDAASQNAKSFAEMFPGAMDIRLNA